MVFVVIFSLKGEKQAIRQSLGASKPSVSAGATEISPGFLLLTARKAQCTLLSREYLHQVHIIYVYSISLYKRNSISGCTPTKGKTNPYDQSQLNNSTINFHVVRRECTTSFCSSIYLFFYFTKI